MASATPHSEINGEVRVRKAELRDYKAVIGLNRNIYTGFDYITTMFYEFLHLAHFDALVGDLNGKLVGRNYIKSL